MEALLHVCAKGTYCACYVGLGHHLGGPERPQPLWVVAARGQVVRKSGVAERSSEDAADTCVARHQQGVDARATFGAATAQPGRVRAPSPVSIAHETGAASFRFPLP